MPLTIYGMTLSPPTRTVLITAKVLGLPYDFKVVSLHTGDHRKPEYLKINPLHTIPSIDDNGAIIVDSHAIAAYLASKYGKNDSLYPKDFVQRALVDQRLHFDTGVVSQRLREHVVKILHGDGVIPEEVKNQTVELFKSLESLLGDYDWIAHTPSFTIADIAILSTIESLELMNPNISEHPKLATWKERAHAKIPHFSEIINEGNTDFKKFIAIKAKKA